MNWHARIARSLPLALFVLALAPAARVAEPAGPTPPTAVLEEARELLARLVAIDTTEARGTADAVALLAAHLRAAGFAEEDLLLVGPRREKLNLVARLRGSGARKPVLFLSHLDVVEATREAWTFDPFTLTAKDGFYYGRGTLDIKGEVVDLVVNFARLKRERLVPDRDLYLALTADEEGGEDNGARWLLANRRDLVDAAYVVNTDAGGLQLQHGALVRMPVQTAEKLYLTFDVETAGAGGHSSLPTPDNAIYRLAAALSRLAAHEFPLRLNDTTRLYFERLAATGNSELTATFRGLLADPPDPAAVAALSARPMYNGLLRTTCTPTMLTAGTAENALPPRAAATVQCRLQPDEDPLDIQRTLVDWIADERAAVTPRGAPSPAPASPVHPDVFAAVEAVTASMWPGVPVLPAMDPWSTDGAHFRRAGIPVYGISGLYFDVDDVRSHGNDERISVAAFEQALEFMYRLMRRLGNLQ